MAHIAASRNDQRAAPRIDTETPATLRIDRQPVDATVLDISSGGLRVRSDAPLTIGQRVQIGAGGRQLGDAAVVWAAGLEHGLEFDRPLTLQHRDAVHLGGKVVVGPFQRLPSPPVALNAPGIGTSAGLITAAGVALLAGVAASLIAAPYVFIRRLVAGE